MDIKPPRPKASLIYLMLLAAMIILPTTVLKPRRAPRNGPLLPPPPPPPPNTSTLVFSPRTTRESAYLSKPFSKDFFSLTRVSRVLLLDDTEANLHLALCSIGSHSAPLDKLFTDLGASPLGGSDDARVETVIKDDKFPKLAVVRNPMTRTLAAFLEVVIGGREFSTERKVKLFHWWVFHEFPIGRSFTAEELHIMDERWAPQHVHCGMHKARVFRLFRYEAPEHVSQFVRDVLPKGALEEGNGIEIGEREVQMERFYNVSVFDRVSEFARRDIEMFGYEREVEEMRNSIVEKEM